MEEILSILSKIEGVRGVAIISNEGLIITSLLPNDLDPDAVSGMCASSFKNGITTAKVLSSGKVKHILIETDSDFIIFSSLGNGFLATISLKSVNLGYLRIKIDKCIREIKEKMLE
jgi:predicted regulator of Ras-like GTPase activity (Roadblock/LC7/MglB family)